MSETSGTPDGNLPETPRWQGGRPPALLALAAIVALEAAAMAAIAVWLIVELLVETPRSLASALALVVMAAGASAFLVAVVIGALRRAGWIRGAIVTWQIVQIAVAIGALQGTFARPDIGWLILAPSIAAILLTVSPTVSRALARD
ncbi:hypothetical protein [Planctomonas deserti]|uniref:hypothetical protein n=1 Tax=Planctomonas deserti TaxID=2144185 RepID=UPI001F0CA606|nr:hypothetical protein [Planctomonas deserti]